MEGGGHKRREKKAFFGAGPRGEIEIFQHGVEKLCLSETHVVVERERGLFLALLTSEPKEIW